MSLLFSSFGDYSFDSGLNLGLKTLKTSGLFDIDWNTAGGGYYGSFQPVDDIQHGVMYTDSDVTTAPGYISVKKLDVPNKRIQYIQGPSRTFTSATGRRPLANPFISNGNGWLINNPGIASTGLNVYQTTDGGASYGLASGVPAANIREANNLRWLTASWFDGTTFAFLNTASSLISTTDGVNFTSNGGGYGVYGYFGTNNRSSYSGYWFAYESGSSYSYRTSLLGSKTTVSGYILIGMSPNGRHLVRCNTSTYYLERSTDGGASWAGLSETMHYGTASARACVDNNGNIFMCTLGGCFYNYNFTLNKWVMVAYAPFDAGSSGNAYIELPQVIKLGGVECMASHLNGVYGTWLMELPPTSN